ncbi:PilZ domain-containing protein [Novosphingobium sp. CF614]|uniref:PilZ domain-containing protein n=1 Tax=Novosphingobium sp. CF614 TaxID=1884364 RepID=UPI0008F1CD6D|nr:PilZ domain-containing protein [Novosphingobium sp. CF614]SFG17598.1 PilZ domain-containing protein [Novosphingobium sp. CF614]
MNAPIGRLYAAPQDALDERRRDQRRPIRFEALLETSKGSRLPVLLADVSLHGCCVQADAALLRQGAFVSIGLGEGPMLPAIVRWVRGRAAGMEFLRAVPPERAEWFELMDCGLDG